MATLKLITGPTEEPVCLDELKDTLRIEGTAEDSRLTGLIKAAREFVEEYLDTRLVTQTVDLTLDSFPGDSFDLDVYPIQSVSSVKYDSTDSPSVETTLTVDVDYRVDTDTQNGRIISIDGWPSVYRKFNSVRVRMIVGYGDATVVPDGIKEGLKLYAASIYDCNPALMKAAENLLWPYRNVQTKLRG